MKKFSKKIIFIIPLINIAFPIISVEDIIPWVSTAVFIYLCYKRGMDGHKSYKRVCIYTLSNVAIILGYNILVKIITNYMVKLYM